MKVVAINIQIPKWVDDFFKEEARTRMASKSMVVREVLSDHVKKKQQESSEAQKAAA